MGGMFPSTVSAVATINWPSQLVTPVVLGDPLTVDVANDPTTTRLLVRNGSGTVIYSPFLADLPVSGISYVSLGNSVGVQVVLQPSVLSGQPEGLWSVSLGSSAVSFVEQIESFQWGYWVDILFDSVELSRKALLNKWVPNSATVPTLLALKDDDNTTTIGSRTIANADGSAVSPAQVLSLGKLA